LHDCTTLVATEGSVLKGRNAKISNEKISRKKFIRLGGALGASVAGASVLAACGGDPSGQSASGSLSSNSSARAPAGKASAGQKIAQTSKVPSGSAVNFEDRGNPAVLVHLQNGKFAAYSAVCTHQGCTVAYQNGELACPCHGSIFDPSKGGAVLYGPAPSPLPQIPIRVQNGGVYLT
jgi:cytochrome b6-f complex iron-sulfur subunit